MVGQCLIWSVTVNGSLPAVYNVPMCMQKPTEGYFFHAKYHIHQFIDAGIGPLKLLIFGNFENIITTYLPCPMFVFSEVLGFMGSDILIECG